MRRIGNKLAELTKGLERFFTLFLAICIISLSVGGASHVPSMKSSDGSNLEASLSVQDSKRSPNLGESHCGLVCLNFSCHAGLCHILTKFIYVNLADLDLTSVQIISNFRKPKSPYLEGYKKPPRLS
jgi:hypothetical protein